MNKTKFLKGACQHCGGHLEFLAEHIGLSVPCPHCGVETELTLLQPPEEPTVPRRALVWTGIAVIVLGLGLGGALIALKRAERWAQQQKRLASAPAPAPSVDPPQATPSQPTNSISQLGLEGSEVTIQKTSGSSLIYAIGTVKNTKDRQCFGVKVELELSDSAGQKVGTTSDYRQVLEAGAQWNFKALILDSKAVSAKISSIREDQ
jgi:hypothetical protein